MNSFGFDNKETITNLIFTQGLTRVGRSLFLGSKVVFVAPTGGNTTRIKAMWLFFRYKKGALV